MEFEHRKLDAECEQKATVVRLLLTIFVDGGPAVTSITLYTEVDGECDKLVTIIGRLLTAALLML